MAQCDVKRALLSDPSDSDFINEMMHARYSKEYYPAYRDFNSTKNKEAYRGLALAIYENAKGGKYEQG